MTFTAITADGKMFTLGSPLSCRIEYEQGVPADALTAVFPYMFDIPQLAYMMVQKDKKPVFTGVVDEQRFLSVEGEGTVMLSARSLAALLLDNEAMPQSYNSPDAQTIFMRHIQPLGIMQYSCEKKPKAASFTVDKGSTHWQVLESFCKTCLDSYPAVDEAGRVCMCGRPGGEDTLLFANTGDGIRFTRFEKTVKRCKRLSEVLVKTSVDGSYSMPVQNDTALLDGVIRRRYLNASELSGNSVLDADKMIREGEYASFEITLSCPCSLLGCMGRNAQILYGKETYSGLYISGLQYTCAQEEEKTVLIFSKCRKE